MHRCENHDAEIVVEFGRIRLPIDTLLNLRKGSLIETGTRHTKEREEGPFTTVEIRLNGDRFAVGEVVTIGEKYGVRVLELVEDGN